MRKRNRRLGSAYASEQLERQQMVVERQAYLKNCSGAAKEMESFRRSAAAIVRGEPGMKKDAERMVSNTEKYLSKQGCAVKFAGLRRKRRK